MNVSGPGEGSMDSNYRCQECTSDGLQWEETTCALEGMTGIANERKVSRERARELSRQLQNHFKQTTAPVWIAVQNRGEDDPDQYWVGRALRIKQVFKEAGSVGRVRKSPHVKSKCPY